MNYVIIYSIDQPQIDAVSKPHPLHGHGVPYLVMLDLMKWNPSNRSLT